LISFGTPIRTARQPYRFGRSARLLTQNRHRRVLTFAVSSITVGGG
jgi:hypothetical protein